MYSCYLMRKGDGVPPLNSYAWDLWSNNRINSGNQINSKSMSGGGDTTTTTEVDTEYLI